jgi:predicted house-cleaning NTP pyrophosphatase (Maf/HAM1 superfamily)
MLERPIYQTAESADKALTQLFEPFFSVGRIKNKIRQRKVYEYISLHYIDPVVWGENPDMEIVIDAKNVLREILEKVDSNIRHKARKRLSQKIEPRTQVGHVLLASNSSSKLHLVKHATLGLDVPIIANHDPETIQEEEYKEQLELFRSTSRSYPVHMSGLKIGPFLDQPYPILGLDSIVQKGREKYEKPTDLTQAHKMITTLSGQRLNVIVGLTLGLTTLSEDQIGWQGSVITSFNLKNLTSDQIKTYVNQHQDEILNICGGINYATDTGKNLIDPSQPVIVRPFEYGNDYTDRTNFIYSDFVQLGLEALKVLDSYFLGAPLHPLRSMFSKIPLAYKTL